MPISRKPRDISRRDGYLSTSIKNERMLYSIDVTIGSNSDQVSLQLDTGSSDMWTFSPSACSAVSCEGGSYDETTSTTATEIAPGGFSISYVDQDSVTGDYISDNVVVNGITVQNLQMGWATAGTGATIGIMGVGFRKNEATTNVYPNIIDAMYNQGTIGAHQYSLWLDDLSDSSGSIMFGGYDTSYTITNVPIVADSDGVYRSFGVDWQSLSATDSSGSTATFSSSSNIAPQAILDSGTTMMLVPTDLYNSLASYFNVQQQTVNGYSYSTVDCGIQGSLDFGFDGVTISVSFSEVAVPIDSTGYCQFGFSSNSDIVLLGDTFLRSAYVVYDLDNYQIGLAQTVFSRD